MHTTHRLHRLTLLPAILFFLANTPSLLTTAAADTPPAAARAADAVRAAQSPAEIAAELRAPQPPKTIHHDFIAIDEGLGTMLRINENNPSQNWRVTALSMARDMQLIGHGRLLISYDNGYAEYDIATGALLKKFSGLAGVTAARRQPDGSTLLAGVDLAGRKGVCVLHLDSNNQVLDCAVYPGDYIRLLRQTAQVTYLMCNNTEIREATSDGILRTFPVDGFKHAWKAVRLANNHMVVSGGYGAFMVELDEKGNVVRKFSTKDQLPAGFNPNFAATFQILPNGNIVQVNWQGHGPKNGASGVQLFETDPSGKVVWQWSRAPLISSLQGVMVLDGLDLSRLHDERTGTVAPMDITPAASTVREAVYTVSTDMLIDFDHLSAFEAITQVGARLRKDEEASDKAYAALQAQAGQRIAERNAREAAEKEERKKAWDAALEYATNKRAIAAAIERLRKAMLASDGPALADIAAENLLYCHSSGKQQNKKEFVDTIVQGHSVFLTLEFSEQVINISGDTAIVHNRLTSDTRDDGNPGHVDLGVMLVWKKIDGQWKLIGRQAAKLKP